MGMNNKLDKVLSYISKHDMQRDILHRWKVYHTLTKITDQDIIDGIGMAEMPKILYLLGLKHRDRVQWIPIENDVMVRIGETNVANMSYLAVYLHFLEIDHGVLHIEGNISLPVAAKLVNSFYIRHNGKKVRCKMLECGLDCKLGSNVYEKRTVFLVEIQLEEEENRIEFFNCINGMECQYGKINSMRFSPVADCIKEQYCRFDTWLVYIQDNFLVSKKIHSVKEVVEREKDYQEILLKRNEQVGKWAVNLREKYFAGINAKKKPIWLFMDRPDRADDNAEVFFKYMQLHKDIDTYFIVESSSKDYERMAAIGNVVALYSEQHFLLVLLADYVISSQCNGVVENPFWEKAEMFRDLYHRPKFIFLQHGVIKDDMSPTLNRFNTNFTGFITSTQAEWQSIIDYPYYYDEKEVWLTGLPRFDDLKDRKEKIILVMPSWRQGLMEQFWDTEKNNMKWILKSGFEQSVYFRTYKSLFDNIELVSKCKDYGYKIVFAAHPLMKPYVEKIVKESSIEIWDEEVPYKEFFERGALLITDYSSVAFDFIRMEKPVIYYQFDKEQFFKEHTYRLGYFDYETDGFGEVCSTERELIETIQKYLINNCCVEGKYKQRIDNLWSDQKESACKKIYEKIMENVNR